MPMDRKKLIEVTVDDLVSDFLVYGRSEDEDLPRGSIEEAIKAGEITVSEIIARFEKELREGVGEEVARG